MRWWRSWRRWWAERGALAERQGVAHRDVPARPGVAVEPVQQQVEGALGERARVGCHGGEARRRAGAELDRVPADDRDVAGYVEPVPPQGPEGADRGEVVAAQQPVELQAGGQRGVEGLAVLPPRDEPPRVRLQAGLFQRGPVALDPQA